MANQGSRRPDGVGKTGQPPRFDARSDIEIRNVYGPEDLKDFSCQRDLGAPGEFPFTRGIHPSMYRGRLWTMRQYAGFGTPAETNERFKYQIGRAHV